MDVQCPDTDWNMTDVAPAYSQLAGVLAGFVFTGIILLLTQKSLSVLRVRTLVLFVAAFFVLALNSYQWGLMAGDSIAVEACNRMWTEGQIASGLLGLGAMAIISGINWLLAAHLEMDQEAAGDDAEVDLRGRAVAQLELLCRLALYSMATIVALLLAVTSHDYLKIVLIGRGMEWLQWTVLGYPLLILTVILGLQAWRRRSADGDEQDAGAHGVALAIKLGALGAVIYTAVSTVLFGSIIGITGTFWENIPYWMVLTTLAVTLLAPAPSLVALVYGVPRFGHRSG
jgi:hypothetical protein